MSVYVIVPEETGAGWIELSAPGPFREGGGSDFETKSCARAVTPAQPAEHAASRTKCPRCAGDSLRVQHGPHGLCVLSYQPAPTRPLWRAAHGKCLTRWQGVPAWQQ